MDLMRFVVFLVVFLALFVFGIGLAVNFPHTADEKYSDVFKSSVIPFPVLVSSAQDTGTDTDLIPADTSDDTSTDTSSAKDSDDEKEDGILSGLVGVLRKPFDMLGDLLETIISGMKTVSNMIGSVYTMVKDLFSQISDGILKSVEAVRSIPVFGNVLAGILISLMTILTIFFLLKVIDILLP